MNHYDDPEVQGETCSNPDEMSSLHDGALAKSLLIVNKKGLHARATAKLVQLVERFDAEVRVGRWGEGEMVGGTSIMGILTLGAGIGTTIKVTARGREAADALEAIGNLVTSRFGEDE